MRLEDSKKKVRGVWGAWHKFKNAREDIMDRYPNVIKEEVRYLRKELTKLKKNNQKCEAEKKELKEKYSDVLGHLIKAKSVLNCLQTDVTTEVCMWKKKMAKKNEELDASRLAIEDLINQVCSFYVRK